ncbi:MAG: stage II sporulation protein M, partial [Chloroflexi bacterium]
MSVNDFIRLREKDWARLQALLTHCRGHGTLSAGEVRELGMLYRAAISDLALAQRDYPGQAVTVFLNQLLTQVHSYVYKQNTSDFRDMARYFVVTIPAAFRQTFRFTLAAFLLFALPALIAFQMARHNPDVAGPLGLSDTRESLANHDLWTNIPIEARPYASTFIMTNNIRVALLAFGGGMVLGLFSVYLLAMNGVILGAVFGLAAHYGMGMPLLEFVFAHGVLELSIIFIAGGAGLQLGWSLISPGDYTRKDAVGLAARRAVPLAVVAIQMLIVA